MHTHMHRRTHTHLHMHTYVRHSSSCDSCSEDSILTAYTIKPKRTWCFLKMATLKVYHNPQTNYRPDVQQITATT